MTRRLLLSLMLVFASISAFAEGQTFEEGTHYDVISPAIRTADPEKIEVTEFFWYGCGHCFNFEPMLEQWKKTLPEDVNFQPSPAVWNPTMELHARAFYTAEVLGVGETMHPALFQALNVERKRLTSESELADLFAANGVSKEEFTKAFNSFGVSSQVRQANSRARTAKISGTPSMMVDGKYVISARKAGNQANMLKLAEFLVEKERAARAGT